MANIPFHGGPAFARFLARGIQLLRSASPQSDLDAYFTLEGGTPLSSFFKPATTLNTAFYYVKYVDRAFLLLDGATNISQALRLYEGYKGLPVPLNPFEPGNFAFHDMAAIVVDEIKQRGIVGSPRLEIGGYSFGGAVAFYLPPRFADAGIQYQRLAIDTFGSPRPFQSSVRNPPGQTFAATRWMSDRDPIPLIPPHFTEAPQFSIIVGAIAMERFGRFHQPAGGVNIDAGGVLTVSSLPRSAEVNVNIALGDWYLQWDQGGQLPHSLATYIARLDLSINSVGGPSNVPVSKVENPAPVPSADVNEASRELTANILTKEHEQRRAGTFIPVPNRFRAFRVGKLWFVQFNGPVIAIPGSKRAAKALARIGNAFLNSLQDKAVVDPVSLLQAWSDYISDAQIPESTFMPKLSTEIPQ